MTQAALRVRPGGADHEAKLARAAATGDGRAFATLYDRYEQRFFNLAFRITGSPEHAARATREAFLDVLHALPRLNGGEPRFGSCLLTLLDHLAHCGGCRARLDAMQRAGAAYDRWEPVAAPPALFGETVAAAAPAGSAAIDELGAQRSAGPARWGTTGLVCLMLLGLAGIWAGTALVLRSNDRSPPTASSAADADRLSEGAPARVQRPERRPRVGMTPKAKKVGGAPQDVRIAPQSVVVIGTRPVAERPKATPDKRRRRNGQGRRRTPQAEAVPLKKPTPSPPASQPAPTQPPAGTAPQPQPAPSGCKDPAGNPVPCPG